MSQSDESKLTHPLGDMSPEDFRRHGHEIIDWIGDYLAHTERYAVLPSTQPGDVRRALPEEAPARGEDFAAIFDDVKDIIAPSLTHWNHPSFFAYFAITASAPGIFGELLCAAFNVNQMLWRTAPAATELEGVAVSWLRQMIGLPDNFDGLIYDTASVSTLHAIAAARENLNLDIRERGMSRRDDALPLLRVYTSEQAHSSVEKALILLGLGQNSLRKIPVDAEFRMDAAELERAIVEDTRAGALPFCVVATVGTTSTTSVDPVPAIADVCERHKLWLHVDAAYAGSAAVIPELQFILDGCARADSLVTNPHKWLFTPFDCSVLYTRRMDVLRRAFSLIPEYLKTDDTHAVMNGMDYGVQLGRRFRSLKLWMVMRYFGQEGLAARLREHNRLGSLFTSWIKAAPDWELLAPVPFSTICFRFAPHTETDATSLDALNERLMHAVNATGEMFISHTRLHDRFALRLTIGHIRTTETHIEQAWNLLRKHAAHLSDTAA
ncbi:MAG: pyridoxal-dependent decarboxylase [Pyrinomonadaceae bacterium MAG19_C2-C3]|nr:pyridoxal-dependent decarboxylase [Pyrinomonadaceae bacterium MAG19_C2-C3]